MDFKGPFSVQGKKYWFLVCIDDYSRFIIVAEQFDHELTTAETVAVLEKQKRFPKAILSDHGSQFKEQWKNWCVLLIRLILRIRARLNGAFKTLTENLLITCASSLNGSKANYASTETGLTIYAFIEG
ncbi:MAG: integrase catalytic domain-containing protein [Candidatus Bathyarchaeia archaeon]